MFCFNGVVKMQVVSIWAAERPDEHNKSVMNRPGPITLCVSWKNLIGLYSLRVRAFRVRSPKVSYFTMPSHASRCCTKTIYFAGPLFSARSNRDTNNLSKNRPDKWTGSGGPVAWPARSRDLAHCNFILWGLIKIKDIMYNHRLHGRGKYRIRRMIRRVS